MAVRTPDLDSEQTGFGMCRVQDGNYKRVQTARTNTTVVVHSLRAFDSILFIC